MEPSTAPAQSIRFFHVPTSISHMDGPRTCPHAYGKPGPVSDHTGPKASKPRVDRSNDQTQQHRRGDDDAHRAHHGAATAFSLLAFVPVVTHTRHYTGSPLLSVSCETPRKSLVVRFSGVDFVCAIDLLQQNHPHQLVRERHFGKAQQVVGSFEDRGVESQ